MYKKPETEMSKDRKKESQYVCGTVTRSVCDKYCLLESMTCSFLFHRDGIQVQTMGPGVGNIVLRQKLRTILPSFLKGGKVKYM